MERNSKINENTENLTETHINLSTQSNCNHNLEKADSISKHTPQLTGEQIMNNFINSLDKSLEMYEEILLEYENFTD